MVGAQIRWPIIKIDHCPAGTLGIGMLPVATLLGQFMSSPGGRQPKASAFDNASAYLWSGIPLKVKGLTDSIEVIS